MSTLQTKKAAPTLAAAKKAAKMAAAKMAANKAANKAKKAAVAAKKAAAAAAAKKAEPVKPNSLIKLENRVIDLDVKAKNKTITRQELLWLCNARIKIVSRSRSKVYNYLSNEMDVIERTLLLGSEEMPTFKVFNSKMPNKFWFTYYDGLRALSKLNVKAELQAKADRQRKAAAKKAAKKSNSPTV